jgi:hypothetical protein
MSFDYIYSYLHLTDLLFFAFLFIILYVPPTIPAVMEAVLIVIVVYVSYEDNFDDLTLESRKELLGGENGTIFKLFIFMNIIIIGSSCCLFGASKGAAVPIVAGVYQIVYALVVLNCALKFVLFSFGLRRGGEIEGLSAI